MTKIRVPSFQKTFWTSDKLMSFLALIVSAGTMFTIIYQNTLIRKQQYASVLPYLIINHSYGDVINSNLLSCRVELYNNGIGPAFIESAKFKYKGNEYVDLNSFFANVLHSPNPGTSFSINSIISEAFVLSEGQAYPIISSNDSASANVLADVLETLQIEITYSSVYGETWVSSNRKKPIKLD